MNLIPDRRCTAPHYWCTWMAQTGDFVRPGDIGGADHIDERLLFDSPGWLASFFQAVRGDLIALIDAGWDIPRGHDADAVQPFYGAMRPDPGRFPSLRGSATQQLDQLNRRVLDLGWRGTGLWVIAQGHGESSRLPLLDDARVEADYRNKADWSRDAGIAYWKVDFGMRGESLAFRRMLTRVLQSRAPGILIEHARNQGPFNGEQGKSPGTGADHGWNVDPTVGVGRWKPSYHQPYRGGALYESCLALVPLSDVLRTYDVSWPLSTAITLDRVAAMLDCCAGDPLCRAMINCEDEPYMAAGLGCVMGILRYPEPAPEKPRSIDPHGVNQRCDEVVRALRWSRIAPPLPAGALPVTCDTVPLADHWLYEKGDVWVDWALGKVIRQGAPARVARGMSLPTVACASDPPFVVSMRHPNGSAAVATLPRTLGTRRRAIPLADVTLDLPGQTGPIGVFGRYKSLTLRGAAMPAWTRVLAQDLAGDSAQDVTGRVERIDPQTLRLPGEVIDSVGLSARSRDDQSDPGLVLAFGHSS